MFNNRAILFIFTISTLLFGTQLFAQSVQNTSANERDNWEMEKARNEYWNTIRTSGEEKDLGKIEMNAYKAMRSMENRVAFKSQSNPAWIQIAGSQEGHNTGRVRDISIDPNNPNVAYITTGSGGVWKTLDITAKPIQWISLSDRLPTLMGGAIAFIPPSTLILGTGEAEGDGSKYPPGQGLFKSSDGGNNWTQVSTIGGGYSQIFVDSLNPQIIYAAFVNSPGQGVGAGMVKSTDGGDTWRKLSLSGLTGPISFGYNSHQPLVIVAGGYGSIYRSADSGATWTKSMSGISGSVIRVAIANAPSNPNLFYASIGTGTGALLGVWASTDAGLSWSKTMGYNSSLGASSTNANPLGTAQTWCNTITVRPANPKQVFISGADTYVSADGGVHWTQLTAGYPIIHNFPANYVHTDHHRISFLGNTMYDCSDGGLARAVAPYGSWSTDVNHGLSVLQFVGVDADKKFTFVTGGCQDNSTNRALVNDPEFLETNGGDGGRGWVSPDDSTIVYTTYIRTTFYQSNDAGKTFSNSPNLIEPNTQLFRIDELGQGKGEGAPFYPAYDVSSDGTIVAFGGNSHIWLSVSGGADNFTAVPPSKSTQIGAANVVHVFQGETQTSYMWAGAGNSVWRSVDQGNTWTNKNVGELVMGITSNPTNHNEIYVVTEGTGASLKHFFKSEDGGATFSNPATNFPNIGCLSIAYNPNNGNLYVGTEKGVIYSFDGGATWNPLMNGMPLAEVTSLKIKGLGNDTLLAGTYGRGMFWIDLSQVAGVTTSQNASQFLSLDPSYPNPIVSGTATIGFTLKEPGLATITLHDVLGRELRTIEKSYFDSGSHEFSFDRNGLSTGTYFILLTENGRSVSEKIILN